MSSTGKKLFNSINECVDDSLKGFTLAHPTLTLHSEQRFVCRTKQQVTSNVAVLSGGGSGHEPFTTGYVGKGMLSGAVAGNIFASPPKAHILHALKYLNNYYKGGIFVIIPNYTGDCLNFGMAVEQAKADGINVDSFAFGEDCASGQHSKAGRRGMCGILLSYKICGSLATNGKNLNYILKTMAQIQDNISTLGISLGPCSLPGQPPLFAVAKEEMELGTGIHGEAGIERLKLTTAKEAVGIILQRLYKAMDLNETSTSVVVIINNLGTTSQLEQNIICKEVHVQISERNIKIERMYTGVLVTSLDMAGFQVSILKLPNEFKIEWLQLLDQETDAPSWTGSPSSIPVEGPIGENFLIDKKPIQKGKSKFLLTQSMQRLLKESLHAACQKLIESEAYLNELDAGCGDGDCGTTLRNLAKGILQALTSISLECPAQVLQVFSEIAETKMGGTSGAIYSLGFTSMSKHFTDTNNEELAIVWAEAMQDGLKTVMKYGRAQPGDRTIIDALHPAVDIFYEKVVKEQSDVESALQTSVQEAKSGCEATKTMKARAGRASYVNEDRLKDVDAGAYGFVVWYEAIQECFLKNNCLRK